MATTFSIPIFARGEIIEGADVVNKGRYGASFATPDAGRHLDKLILHKSQSTDRTLCALD